MLILLLAFIYFFFSMVIMLLSYRKKGFRYAWLISLGVAIVAWLSYAIFGYLDPIKWIDNSWMPIGVLPIDFSLDAISWPFGFSIGAMLLAFIFQSTTWLHLGESSRIWAGSLALCGMGVLVATANTPLAVVLAWSGMDLLEFLFVLAITQYQEGLQEFIKLFSLRIVGTLGLLLATTLNVDPITNPTFSSISQPGKVILIIAVLLRLDLIKPLVLIDETKKVNLSFSSFISIFSSACALAILSRISGSFVPNGLTFLINCVAFTLALFFSFRWASASSIQDGIKYWVLTFCMLAIMSSMVGEATSIIGWASAMMLNGAILTFNSYRNKWLDFFMLFGFLGISALPYTPMITGFIINPTSSYLWQLLFIPIIALLQFGYIKAIFQEKITLQKLDQWIKVALALSLLILIITHWWIGLKLPSLQNRINFLGVFSLLLSAVLYLGWKRIRPFRWLQDVRQEMNGFAQRFLQNTGFQWLKTLISRLLQLFEIMVENITKVLEGDGGVLWAILLLTLLISAIQANLSP